MSVTARTLRTPPKTALFSFGFRPFFLFSAAWAALAVPIWIGALLFGDGLVAGGDGRSWHVDEMLFGYAPGVIAGFLLTAVPNWTGRLPVTGLRLAALFSLWAAGRIGGLVPGLPPALVQTADVAFLFVFAGLIAREILGGRNRKNLPVAAMVFLLACAHLAWHLTPLAPQIAGYPERGALALVAGLILLIGGRIVPSFTINWLKSRGLEAVRPAAPWRERLTLGLSAAALLGWAAAPSSLVTGALLIAAGVANLTRLAGWNGLKTGGEALVWILHLGYLWVPVAMLLLGLSALAPETFPATAGLHALTAGGIGVMTLAVTTRASLGHTGRPREADAWTIVLYLLVLLAAVARVAAPFVLSLHVGLLAASALLWSAAFAVFCLRYGPMLALPRR